MSDNGDQNAVLTIEHRLEAMAILDRLLNPETTTFDPADVSRLVELLPQRPKKIRWLPTLSVGMKKTSDSTSAGFAAGIGNVEIKNGETVQKEKHLNLPVLWRIGGYKVTHNNDTFTISLMWDDTTDDKTKIVDWRITYKDEFAVLKGVPRSWSFLFFEFGAVVFETWKTPAPAAIAA